MKPRVVLPAVVSGLLLWAAFFPINFGPIAFIALVPWLTLAWAPVSTRRRYFCAYLGGLTFFLLALQWIRVAHPMMYFSWAGLALVCPLFWVAGLWFIRRLDRLNVPFTLSVPLTWVALEYMRAHFPTGFPLLRHVGMYQMVGFGWYFLGYTQHEVIPLIQAADLGGVYVISALVAAANGLAFDWLIRSATVSRWLSHGVGDLPRKRVPILATVGVVAALGVAVAYGYVELDHPPFIRGPRVAAIQGDVPQDVKMQNEKVLFATYDGLTARAFQQTRRPDLIVWPETCSPFTWYEFAPNTNVESVEADFRKWQGIDTKALRDRHFPTSILYGMTGMIWENGSRRKYNSAVLLDPHADFRGRYDKMHLVPFGEYVPFKETFPFLQVFTPYKDDYSCRPGATWTRFPLRTVDGREFTFACLICYEDSDPGIARQYGDAHGPIDFLVNISNDGWFKGTEEHEEHLAICRFRAIETRRSIVRAVNMGISAVIDPDGRVIALPGPTWHDSKKMEGIVSADVPIDHKVTLYSRAGDWLPYSCWGLLMVGVIAGGWVNRRPAVDR